MVIQNHSHHVWSVHRVDGTPEAVRVFWDRLRRAGIVRCYNHHAAIAGADDADLKRLADSTARLYAEDVRWDVINASHTGRRHRATRQYPLWHLRRDQRFDRVWRIHPAAMRRLQ